MQCPGCDQDTPPPARICMKCGAGLGLTCAHCGTDLPPVAAFCLSCGHPVAQPPSGPPVPPPAKVREAPQGTSHGAMPTSRGALEGDHDCAVAGRPSRSRFFWASISRSRPAADRLASDESSVEWDFRSRASTGVARPRGWGRAASAPRPGPGAKPPYARSRPLARTPPPLPRWARRLDPSRVLRCTSDATALPTARRSLPSPAPPWRHPLSPSSVISGVGTVSLILAKGPSPVGCSA